MTKPITVTMRRAWMVWIKLPISMSIGTGPIITIRINTLTRSTLWSARNSRSGEIAILIWIALLAN